jgi:hypothetical protein
MSTDRDTTRLVRSWLDEGVTALPDRILDAVLDQVPATPQRRVWWPARRLFEMNRALAYGVAAAAAVVVAALLGFNYLISPNIGARSPSEPSPTPAAPADVMPPGGPLDAGPYQLGEAFPVPLAFDLPSGLESCGDAGERVVCLPSAIGVSFLTIENVVVDPCDPSDELRDPPVGPSVDDLVTAIRELPGFQASSVADVTVDGYAGKEFEVTAPVNPGCGLATWASPGRVNGVGEAETNRIRIVDVDGTRVAIFLAYFPSTPHADVIQLQEIVDSVRFDDR